MSKFIDKLSLFLKAGGGAQGASSFRREKYVPKGGPDGGNGGAGGSIFLSTNAQINSFSNLKQRKKSYSAENGKPGRNKKKHGSDGQDLTIDVPIGTVKSRINRARLQLQIELKDLK